MKNEKIIVDQELYADFLSDCKCIYFEKEYPKHIGKERFLILSDLSEKELRAKYGILLKKYEPFILDTMRLYEPIHEFELNEDKHFKRYIRNTINIEISDLDERFYKGLQINDVLDELIFNSNEEKETNRILFALNKLSESQLRRLLLWALKDKTYKEIGIIERVSEQSVYESIQAAKDRFMKFYEIGDENDGE